MNMAFELLHVIPDGACIIDGDYHVIFWNKRLVQWSGMSQESVLGKNIMELFPSLLRTKYRLRIDQVLDNGPPAIFSSQLHHHLLEFTRPDASIQPQQVTITPIDSRDNQTLALFTIQDMSQHVRQIASYKKLVNDYETELNQRQSLEKQNAKLVAAIDQAAEAFVITSSTGNIEYINKAFTQQTGWVLDDISQKMSYFDYQASHHSMASNQVKQMIHDGDTWQGRREIQRKDGSLFSVSISIAPILNHLGVVTHAVAVQEDISGQIKLEEQYRQTQKQEALSTLIGGIAHDFNNLLSGMLGHLYLAGREVKALPKTAERLKKVQAVANEAAEIVQQLMTFARKDEIEKRKFPLDSFLKEFIKLAERVVPESIQLSIDFEHGDFACQGDAERLQQSLLNIVQNAVDSSTQQEGSRIQLNLQAFDVSEDSHWLVKHPVLKHGRHAQITIWDNGPGIVSEHLERIFDPFFTTKQMGSGLGLSVVAGNIKHNHGVVDVESSAEGTQFHIWLPLLQENTLQSEDPTYLAADESKLVLLVDDEAMVRETCSEILESLGYKVLEAEDGQDAVLIMEQHTDDIDLVLMDMVMPRMNGPTSAKHIRKMSPNLPIIFATAYDQTLSIKDTEGFENSILIAKPFHPDALQDMINRFLFQS
ncbi:MAG: PAS domain S-box protein [Ghiorsea sp.]